MFAVLTLLFCAKPAWAGHARKGPLKVFILASQSNMEGQGVVSMDDPHYFRKAQEAGTRQIKHAIFVKTTDFARPPELSPNAGHGHHWFGNAESYFLIGDALGEGMKKLLEVRGGAQSGLQPRAVRLPHDPVRCAAAAPMRSLSTTSARTYAAELPLDHELATAWATLGRFRRCRRPGNVAPRNDTRQKKRSPE